MTTPGSPITPDGTEPKGRRKRRGATRPIAVLVVVAAAVGILLGATRGTGSRAPSTSTTTTTPLAAVPATMPTLVGRSIEDARRSLAEVDVRGITIRWIADEREEGTVTDQQPAVGDELAPSATVTIIVSAGGPSVGWAGLPPTLREWVRRFAGFDIGEPVRVVETDVGPAFKIDGLLFGTCDAVAAAEGRFQDLVFDAACLGDRLVTVEGRFPDGTPYRVTGLPPEDDYALMQAFVPVILDRGSSMDPIGLATLQRGGRGDADPSVDPVTGRVTASSGVWSLDLQMDRSLWEALDDRTRKDVASALHLSVVDGSPVLELETPLGFATGNVSPVRFENMHGPFTVSFGCPGDPSAVITCDRMEGSVSAVDDWLDPYPVALEIGG